MKARLENGTIKIYSNTPNSFEAEGILVAGGGKNLSEEKLKEYGFLDVVVPSFDDRIEELSPIKLYGDVYTYDVIEKPIKETLADLKANKVNELKYIIGSKLSQTDWYIIRESDSGEATPQSIKDERAALRTQSNDIEVQINASTTKKSVVLFDLNL